MVLISLKESDSKVRTRQALVCCQQILHYKDRINRIFLVLVCYLTPVYNLGK